MPRRLLLSAGFFLAFAPAMAQEPQDEGTAADSAPVIPVAEEPAPLPEAVEDDPAEFEPITTVGTRTPRDPLELPASVSIVTADDIDERQLSNLGEALSGLAGVSIAGGPRANGESINIRGLSGTRVLMSVDGARQNFDGAHRSRLHVDPELLKSVDLLRGPASALWGSDALGGVLALETKDAADLLRDGERFGLRLKTGFEGANDEQLGGATLFGQNGDLDWVAHAAERQAENAELGNGDELPHSALDTSSGLYKATWQPSGAHSLRFSFQRFQQSGESPSNPNQEVADDNPLLARDNDQHYLTTRYAFFGNGLVEAGQVSAYRTALGIVEDRVDEPRHDTLDFETRGISAHTSLRFERLMQRLTVGIDAYHDTSEATRDGAPRPQFPDAQRDVVGVFVQDEIGLGHRWSLIPGLRYDHVRAESNTDAARVTEDDAVSGKLAASYEVTDWMSLHAGYSEAFRAPSLLETYAAGAHFLGNDFQPNPDLRPEQAANVEAGVRWYFVGALGADRIRAKVTAYENDIDDYIETIAVVETEDPAPQCVSPTPPEGCINRDDNGMLIPFVPPIFIGGYTTSVNLRNARIRGLELETSYELAGLVLAANFSTSRGLDTTNDSPLLTIPADTLNAVVSYDLRDWRLGARVTHAADQNHVPIDDTGNPVIPRTNGYTVTDIFLTWTPERLGGMKVALGVDNVADRHYRNHLAPLAEAGINPRASISYQF